MENTNNDIAIVGMTGRFPGARSVEEFWQNLRDGVESIESLSEEQLQAAGIARETYNQPNYVKAAPILKNDIAEFDASFFGLSPREAELLDPQQRFFLEGAWEAMENAGYNPQDCGLRAGIYAGVGRNTYLLFNVYPNRDTIDTAGAFATLISNDKDFLATRVAYFLNFKGASITVQTACSTSLVATHLACQSLLSGENDLVLAGGVSLKVPHTAGYVYQEGGIYSPDGHCRSFDAHAQGTVGGSGMGIVVLKRLEDAIADGDTIRGVIKGSATNNDGAVKVGYTAPSVTGQADVIEEALCVADIHPETIQYVETHGTATPLGDPIEIQALTSAFRSSTQKTGWCAIGSVKSNVGHLDTAAGVAGLIKTVLALENQQIPPSLHWEQPNPQIDFDSTPFFVNTKLQDWQRFDSNGSQQGETPRRAGVSSFGIGGTNAHVIVEEAPKTSPAATSRPQQLLLLSTKTKTALETATTNLKTYLEQQKPDNLADVAYTLQIGRQHFSYRRAIVCENNTAAAVEVLSSGTFVTTGYCETSDRPVCFMFPGQGSQYANMGRQLYEREPVYRQSIDRSAELFAPYLDLDIRDILYADASTEDHQEQLTHTAIAQCVLFAVEYALAQLWLSMGIQPKAAIGHSIGEYVAACLAGVFDLEDAHALVAQRGKLMEQAPTGSMLSVGLPAAELEPMLGGAGTGALREAPLQYTVAAINAPSLCVVSGEENAIARLQSTLEARGVVCRPLHVRHAFHSPSMNAAAEQFAAIVERTSLHPPHLPFISNVTGTWITEAQATDPHYWAQHIRQPVRFADGAAELMRCFDQAQHKQAILLEVGPGRTLQTLVRLAASETEPQQLQDDAEPVVLTSMRHPQQPTNDTHHLLATLGQLWRYGVTIDWQGFYQQEKRRRIPLPTYPFERQRYWIDPPSKSSQDRQPESTTSEELQQRNPFDEWFYTPTWKRLPRRSTAQTVLAASPTTATSNAGTHWLVFTDRQDVGNSLLQQVQQQLADEGELDYICIAVVMGEEFAQIDANTYAINPRQRQDYRMLWQELVRRDALPQQIVHCWNLDYSDSLDLGFYSLLYLAQAIGESDVTEPITFTTVSDRAYEVVGMESIRPEQATLQGICQVISQEYSNISCRLVDVLLPRIQHSSADSQAQREAPLLAQQILGEIQVSANEGFDEAQYKSPVAYRGGYRWIRSFDAISLPATSEGMPHRLKQGGVYLITGGLGGIGLSVARYLADTVQAKLILVTRSGLPALEKGSDASAGVSTSFLTSQPEEPPVVPLSKGDGGSWGEEDKTSQKIRAVQDLKQRGAEVLVLAADASDRDGMESAIATGESRFGPINGVVHAAGVAGGGIIQLKDPTQADAVLSAKVRGSVVLDELLRDRELDFMVLCSSLSSVIGGVGQVDYCAANAFLDAFARDRTARTNQYTVSINWDVWQEVGMAVGTEVPELLQKQRQESIDSGLSPAEGIAAFRHILDSDLPHVLVSTKNLDDVIENRRSDIGLEDKLAQLESQTEEPSTPATTYPRPNLETTYVAPRNSIERTIAATWQDFLGIDDVGIHDDFFELGGHSLLAARIISQLRDRFQQEIPIDTLFKTPTIAGIAAVIQDNTAASTKVRTKSPEPDSTPESISTDASAGLSTSASTKLSTSDAQVTILPTLRTEAHKKLTKLDELSERDVDALLQRCLSQENLSQEEIDMYLQNN
ncbi:type I polyketide synthase [Geitlerinema sp. PCC 9228]|uniref:type I polyketide synthase n=1 Tax=Geitlerinema sp. PCC 9228 TaxID=111611 RepID=UPI0008F9A04E|nr:type I polyketide synthase [Geitlerinema sp. PCC 9228]